MSTSLSTHFTIHTHTSSPEAAFVNSYWIETTEGIVVIDTQLVLSEARKLKQQIAASGQPLAAVIITHPHPDHFNGVGTLLEGLDSIPVYATQATLDGIKATEASKRVQWKGTYGSDYPDTTVLPNTIVASDETITVGGVLWHFQELGAAEASNETVISVDAAKTLFCGDVMYNQVHSWLVEGRTSAWLEQLGEVLQTYADFETIYPGHGQPATLLAMNEQVTYLNTYQALVRGELERAGKLTAASKAAIKARIEQQYPAQWPLAMLVEMNIDGIENELRKK